MEIFRLFGSILIDSKDAENSISKTESKAEKLVSSFGKGIKTAAKWGTAIVAGTAAAATAAAGALLRVDEATAEFRENQAKLQTAFEAAGSSANVAKEAYSGLYRILGDDGEATEATQLLAQLAGNTKSVGMWTDIAAGVMGTFGDALPITSLIEASNETAKVGKVTGALADALNWAGISEDEFNAKLAELSTEEERNRLITYTLSRTYADATDAFKANNEAALASRDSQVKLQQSMATLGSAVSKIKTRLQQEFTPALGEVVQAFAGVIEGSEGADEALQTAIENMITTFTENLPEFLNFGVDIIAALASGMIKNIPAVVAAVPEILMAIWDALEGLEDDFFEMGKQLMGQLWNGFKNSLVDWADSQSTMRAQSGFSHASGLAYVPYDNYPINAHRGEILLNQNASGELLDGMRTIMASTVNAVGAIGGGAIRVEIPININGREFYRASIDDLRAVMRSDPEVT